MYGKSPLQRMSKGTMLPKMSKAAKSAAMAVAMPPKTMPKKPMMSAAKIASKTMRSMKNSAPNVVSLRAKIEKMPKMTPSKPNASYRTLQKQMLSRKASKGR